MSNMEKPLKDLYISDNLDGLDERAQQKLESARVQSAKKCCASADKVLIEAKEALKRNDEERAYVLFMRYMEIIQIIRGKADYKEDPRFYNNLLGPKNYQMALSNFEHLQASLGRRFKLKKEEAEARLLLARQERRDSASGPNGPSHTTTKSPELNTSSKTASDSSSPLDLIKAGPTVDTISCVGLNCLIKAQSSSYIIIDIRPRKDFAASKMTNRFLLNIPEELVQRGVTAPILESHLREQDRELFARRGRVDHIILVSWTGQRSPGDTLEILTDAMTKWDVVTAYRARPVVLDGGYQMWIHTYPLFTTNPHVKSPQPAGASDTAGRLEDLSLSVQYPSLDDQPAQPPVDRATKPQEQPAAVDQPAASTVTKQADQILSRISSLRAQPAAPPAAAAADSRPGVPSRALKPHISEEASARRLVELSKSRLEAERQWQLTRASREHQVESELRFQLQEREQQLLAELRRLEDDQDSWEQTHSSLKAENEALRARLAQLESGGVPPTETAEEQLGERRVLQLEQERQELDRQVRRMRQQRKEKERQLEEERRRQAEQEQVARRAADEEKARRQQQEEEERARKQADEQQRLKEEAAAQEQERLKRQEQEQLRRQEEERRCQEEERRRQEQEQLEEQERRMQPADREQDRIYHTQLKDAGSGGGGLKRSHSSPGIAQLGGTPAAPAFSRDTKPFSRPRRPPTVQAARARRFAPAYGSVSPALTGLKNLGNTCYMNAVVQCINNTPGLSDFFVHEMYQDYINCDNDKSRGEAAEELAAVIKALWSGHYRSIALYDLKDVMGRHHRPFRGAAQQDAHEFLMYLLDFLHEDLNEVAKKQPLKEQENDSVPDGRAAQAAWDDFKRSNRSFVLNLFWGQHKSTVRCSRCHNESVKFEMFSHLSVPMPSKSSQCTLQECLRLYMAGDTISGWKCPKCKNNIEATKTLSLWRLPPILIIHIQRFYNDGLWRKKHSNVDFPLEGLDMSPYVINRDARYRTSAYNLYGVVNHYGSMEGGHYTAYCKAPGTGRWHKFDDHEVYQLNSGAVRSAAGYILFYAAIDSKL